MTVGAAFIRYLPAGYARTLVQVFVPPHLRAAMLILNLAIWLAMPASTGSQRLAMSGREGDGRPPPPIALPPDAASPMPQPDCPPGEDCGPRESDAEWKERMRGTVSGRIPRELGEGTDAQGTGLRWSDRHGGNYVRIDRGIPSSSQPWQRIDHVRINYGGRIIGRGGVRLPEGAGNTEAAHIPLEEWLRWRFWFMP